MKGGASICCDSKALNGVLFSLSRNILYTIRSPIQRCSFYWISLATILLDRLPFKELY